MSVFTSIFIGIVIALFLSALYIFVRQYQPRIFFYKIGKYITITIDWWHYYTKKNEMCDYMWYKKRHSKSFRILWKE